MIYILCENDGDVFDKVIPSKAVHKIALLFGLQTHERGFVIL